MEFSRRNLLKAGAVAVTSIGASKIALNSDVAEAKQVDSPTYKIIPDKVERFNQQNTMFIRALWDKPYMKRRATLKQRELDLEGELDTIALNYAGWWRQNLAAPFSSFGIVGASPLMRWDDKIVEMSVKNAALYSKKGLKPTDNPLNFDDKPAEFRYKATPEVLSEKVKNAAKFLGGSIVGITKLNPNWVYTNYMDMKARKIKEWPKDPAQFKYAVSIGIAMDYEAQRDITSYNASASTGLGYSKMAEVSSAVAKFIRVMGYPAIPIGNDTCQNVPVAIDAGLGELGRNGIIITPELGPRVRLCTVLTDMPLKPDKPIEFGVKKFCENCKKCAYACPSGAISKDPQTDKGFNKSNRTGIVRWPINAEKCFDFWHVNRSACNVCVGVCPFSKRADIWFHSIMPDVIGTADSSLINRFFVAMDDLMGYGARKRLKL